MENLVINVSSGLENLCKSNSKCSGELSSFLAKQIWSPRDRDALMDKLSVLVGQPDCSADVIRAFRTLALDLLKRAEDGVNRNGQLDWVRHQQFSVALSKAVPVSEEVLRFASEYIPRHEPFYRASSSGNVEPQPKKAKQKRKNAPNQKDLVRAVCVFVRYMPNLLRDRWDWADMLDFLSSENIHTRWFASESIIRLIGLSSREAEKFTSEIFTSEQRVQLSIRHTSCLESPVETAQLLTNPAGTIEAQTEKQTHTLRQLLDPDLSDKVVSVCGVLLPKVNQGQKEKGAECLVPVASTQRNLRSLALAVAGGSPVLLQGPVGCGKTALVEHLGRLTGVGSAPGLFKVQLGDQTDSKALLGTYRCTDVPGEFVWQAGSLTRAVTEGSWVLLEDIDYAPMDVISVLLPLLQNGTLSLPGHGDTIIPAPGFRLFATQRLYGSGAALYKQHSAGADILERMWTILSVEPMSRQELRDVIINRYPQFDSVADRLLDVYFLLSAGRHGNADAPSDMEVDSDVGKFLTRDGRMISTRDLMKWCSRVAKEFDVSKTSTANLVFQEALDCFCACLAKSDNRMPLAEAIGAKLNVSKVKAEFYWNTYKPNIEITHKAFTVGRTSLPKKAAEIARLRRSPASSFAFTRAAVSLLERVAVSVSHNEPVLLVGETGTGKTSSVQYMAEQMGYPLRVINMNQQSDSTDLLGGFKPVDLRFVIGPVREAFETMFCRTFSRKQNLKFLSHIQECFSKRKWADLLKLMEHSQRSAVKKIEADAEKQAQWEELGARLAQLRAQVKQSQNALAFSFIEGSLVSAIRQGEWVLLDEINLAAAETLECLSGLLESSSGSIVLMERGDTEAIVRHPNFRLFACMNPATDVGKKDLPPGVRNRFTELYVDELEEPADLRVLVAEYLKGLSLTAAQVDGIVHFYLNIRTEAVKKLTDGTGHRPHYSLRTLCRALRQAAKNESGNVLRSLYEGFCLSFLTELDRSSHPVVERLIAQYVIGKSNLKSLLKQPIPEPPGHKRLQFEGYWVSKGPLETEVPKDYILTPSVRANLRDLVRVVAAGRHPVLLQGETSVGKTSLITWLAAATGNVCMRINNHEHTDLQEYIGCYAADETGKLIFKEGVLVEAMKQGHWIILDELNLAPTDVLEALNRLLDDNRELFIAETQEVVKAHPRFMLLATQNPPGLYGGRKVLSRAFRNRFVELHFDDIPSGELETILHERCSLPPSYAKRLVAIMLELQTRRRGSGVFAGKQGFITLRDLFRWAERYRRASYETKDRFFDWDQQLADNGYMLLAGRVRKPEEETVIREVIGKHLRRPVDPDTLFCTSDKTSPTARALLERLLGAPPPGFDHVVWTYNMRRMAVLVGQALKFGEPVLLVGETGCGKTTVCQLYAEMMKTSLYAVNCHLHTESADFLGGLRPVRHKNEDGASESQRLFEWVDGPLVVAMREGAMFLVDEISLADDSVLERLNSVLETERTLVLAEKGGGDGGQNEVDILRAADDFRVFATMNPGGDYGKKELSPALRNRFTEIWCPQSGERADLVSIIEHNLRTGIHLNQAEAGKDAASGIGDAIMNFITWFINNDFGRRSTVSIRDILSWVNFINVTAQVEHSEDVMEIDPASVEVSLDPAVAFVHGACMVFLDALGSGVTSGGSITPEKARNACIEYLINQVKVITGQRLNVSDLGLLSDKDAVESGATVVSTEKLFGMEPFFIPRGEVKESSPDQYALHAPTTSMNAQRVLRALQLNRPVLLEGSPGVGKTSLVSAIAKVSGHALVRINLSEQTDVSDLFGADLPVEGGEGGQFAWRDGPLLQALRAGHWVVLDELNLASQSVLEGLNACLDHRAEVYVPELGRSFQVKKGQTRLFACQNPLNQGGGRKGLPRSFLNRFTQVYVEPLSRADLLFITHSVYPALPRPLLGNMVDFNHKLYQETTGTRSWGQRGGPWEFNLRDIFRWCDLIIQNQAPGDYDIGEYVGLIYGARMRTAADKEAMYSAYRQVVGPASCPVYTAAGEVRVTSRAVQAGHSFLPRRSHVLQVNTGPATRDLRLLHHSMRPLEDLMKVISMNWMAILVGPASSGKTSLVQLLAQLTGHPLHVFPMNSDMDTTELLGGFEQADLNRHLEAVVRTTRQSLHRAVAELLTGSSSPNRDKAKYLLSLWSRFSNLTQQHDKVHSRDEVVDLQRKLTVIEDLLQELLTVQYSAEVDEQLALVLKIAAQLRKSSSVNRGGQFEWVDSVLVQALQSGHWLLIDNVNFCSPSVLDRLNALLEPQGVLTISERGVIDGQVPTITPHPDFRLILAMDPKYGEISRAMRNRGVEIYILGEEEGGAYDDDDIATLLGASGLVGKTMCDVMLRLHDDVKRHLPFGARCTLIELLRVAAMTYEQLQHGNDVISALRCSSVDVYVKGQTDSQVKKALLELIEGHLAGADLTKHEADEHRSSLLHPGHWPETLPSARDWSDDVITASVRQASTMLLQLVDNVLVNDVGSKRAIPLSVGELLGTPTTADDSDTTDLAASVQPVTQILLEAASPDNWHFLQHWVTQQVALRVGSSSAPSEQVIRVQRLSDSVRAGLEAMFNGLLTEKHQELLASLEQGSEGAVTLGEQPADLRWNPHLLRHLLRRQAQTGNDISQTLNSLSCVANQMVLVSLFSRRWLGFLDGLDVGGQTKGVRNMSPLQLSRAFHTGLLEVSRLPHPVLVHLEPFLTLLKDSLTQHWRHLQGLSDDRLYTVLEKFAWLERFVGVCKMSVKLSPPEQLVPSLALHWSWVAEEVLPHLLTLDSVSGEYVDLMSVTGHLQAALGVDTAASARHLALRTQAGYPHPYRSDAAARLALRLTHLLALLEHPEKQASRKLEPERLRCLLQEGSTAAGVALRVGCELLTAGPEDDLDDAEGCLQQLECILSRHGLRDPVVPPSHQSSDAATPSSAEATPTPTETTPVHRHDLALWPVCEVLNLRAQHQLISRLANHETGPELWEELSRFIDFGSAHLCGSPIHLLTLQSILDAEDKVAATQCLLPELLTQLTWRHLTAAASNSPERWLAWSPPTEENENFTSSANAHSMYSDLLTRAVTGLLVAPPGSKEKNRWLPSNICLGEMAEKTSQLETLTTTLWTHMADIGSSSWNPVNPDRHLVVGSLQRLLAAISSCNHANQGDQSGLRELVAKLASHDKGIDHDVDLSELSIYDVLLPNFVDVTKATIAAVRPLIDDMSLENQSEDMLQKAFENGKAMVHVGLLQSFLLAPQGPVDPAHKKAIQLEYAKQELTEVTKELDVRHQWSKITTGHDLDLTSPDLHPRVTWLVGRQSHLQEQIVDLSRDVAIRPQPPQFQALLQDVRQFTASILSPGRVSGLIAKFVSLHQSLEAGPSSMAAPGCGLLSEARAWMRSLQQFLRRIQQQYPLYRDLTLPFTAGISMILSGTQTLAYCVEVWSSCTTLLPEGLQSEKHMPLVQTVELLGQYPTMTSSRPDLLSLAAELLSERTMSMLRHLQELPTGPAPAPQLTPRVLRLALQQVQNHTLLAAAVEPLTTQTLSRIFSLYVTSWQQAEDARRKRQEEKESLYRFRSTTHGDTLTEEQMEEKELRQAFPSFEQEFEDITVGFTLEDKPKEEDSETTLDEETDLTWTLSEQEMEEVCQVHLSVLPSLTHTPWMTCTPVSVSQDTLRASSIQLCLSGYKVATEVCRLAQATTTCQIDGRLVGSHLLACRALLNSVSQTHENTDGRPYDVYRDPNVPEAVKCRPLLGTFRTAIGKLLADWPEHPTLKQMITVIDRIESFPVTSPLMKFVTGLEVLLNKAHEWETNAARHVSLKAETEALTHQIIDWRKHELRCWRTCLDTAVWKCRQRASRWWFHLYQLVEAALNPPPQEEDDQQTVQDPATPAPPQGVQAIIPALQQFMEGSPFGQFSSRLQLLKTFLCQLVHMDASDKREELIAVLWNVYIYYKQFETQVTAELTRLRSPIEKELKGFVKIARWNDINFYSIKQAVEKTHQTLHKHVKAFEQVLNRPVTEVLTDVQNDWSVQKEAATGSGDDTKDQTLVYQVDRYIAEERLKTFTTVQQAHSLPKLEMQDRMPDLYDKMRRHCGRVLRDLPYHQRITAVNDFTGDIIETVHELQKEVTIQGPDKDKLMKDAKLLQVHKRKALADLFKYLTQIGLSYRKGMLAMKDADPNRHLTATPVNMTAMLEQLQTHRCDSETLATWSGCQEYVLKCVARRALFRDALKATSPELNKANIDRCQGFIDDLMGVVHSQREELAHVASSFNEFRNGLWNLERLAEDAEHQAADLPSLPPQSSVVQWLTDLKSLCVQLLLGLHQVSLVLECCPTTPLEGHKVISPLPVSHLPEVASMTQQDAAWSNITQQIKDMQNVVHSVKTEVDEETRKPSSIVAWNQMCLIRQSLEKLHPLAASLESIEAQFRLPESHQGCELTATLTVLREQLISQREAFETFEQLHSNKHSTDSATGNEQLSMFSESVGELLTSVLVVVQDLVKEARKEKQQQKETDKGGAGDGEQEEEKGEDTLLQDGHLTTLLQKSLKAHIRGLHMDKIHGKLVVAMATLREWSEDRSMCHLTGAACRMLVPVVPMLTQYSHLTQGFITHAIAAHRASAKLLSVLLSVFTQLASKGFCMPAELSDEMAGEGATQFEDIQDGGMGEGEGVKDVSDQIENEDQLDEARKAGEEKNEDAGKQPDVAPEENAIEMDQEFDGKMHDLEAQEGDDDKSDDGEEGDEDKVDKEMGDLGDEQADRLDEQVWGSDEEEDQDQPKEDKDEFGPGAGEQTESELVAKDDNQDPNTGEDKDDKKQQDQQQEEEEGGEEKTKELNEVDEREYDENEVDPHYGDQKQQEEPEAMDLPDDLNLDDEDDEEKTGEDKEGNEGQENPFDIDKMTDGQDEKTEEENGEEKDGDEDQAEEKTDSTQEEENQDNTKEEEQKDKEGENKEEEMDTGEKEEGPPEGEPGVEPQLHPDDDHGQEQDEEKKEQKPEEAPQAAEMSGKTEHDTQEVQQVEQAKDAAGTNEEQQDEADGTGISEALQEQGHEGDRTTAITRGGSHQPDQRQQSKRKPGQSNADRTVGTEDEKVHKRLKTVDRPDANTEEEGEPQDQQKSDLYEHLKDASARHDAQTTDAADADQEQATPAVEDMEEEQDDDQRDNEDMKPDDREQSEETMDVDKMTSAKLKSAKPKEKEGEGEKSEEGGQEEGKTQIDGDKVETYGVGMGPTSTIHTDIDNYMDLNKSEVDVEELRRHLEEELHTWHQSSSVSMVTEDAEAARAAQEAWQGYDALTASLSQELCEQLRLVLEPTQASKLRGDYRTGKRLNMRKVIPYIASQFRKDKIWLRRTKPSKRQYQVMVAVDDSSSMADNHSKQLAFESLAVVANALTLLEVGELGISSFGESVKLLHPFHEQFSNHSGARILQQFTFEQKKTKIAQLLRQMSAVMMEARGRQRGAAATMETSQLLLVVSDGRGLFLEGMEVVRSAVRQAREANLFIVFVIIDNPDNKDSILDIRVPVFKEAGKMPEIKSYMDSFPFPFYIILRDINSLPTTLSDALRQWFELVTASDK